MADSKASLYDPNLTYEENLRDGPFGSFAEGPAYQNSGDPKYDFFGIEVYSPFGIAAGPLPGARFIAAAFDRGFDIVTFKTVRTDTYPCHPAPNVFPIDKPRLDAAATDDPIITKATYDFPLSMANSYGIPSVTPEVWQAEIRRAFDVVGRGQAMLVAFQGTDRGDGPEAFIKDHVRGVQLLTATGARVIEVNLSCPNEGSPELLCFDTATTLNIVESIRQELGDIQLIVKVTYFPDHERLRDFVTQVGPLVDGITAINTVGARVVSADGTQAFPGTAARAKPGISGQAIKHLTREMVERLDRHRQDLGLDYKIIAAGGVQSAEDFHKLRKRGGDIVMSVTGAMWNPELAAEIKAAL